MIAEMTDDRPCWEHGSRVYPVQFDDETTATPRAVRSSCAVMRAGYPVEILYRGKTIAGTIAGIISSVVHVTRQPSSPMTPMNIDSVPAEHLATFWTLRGPTGRDLTCSAYRVETGLELRVEYGPQDIVASELFRGTDADERLAEKADVGRLTLLAKGFREIAKV